MNNIKILHCTKQHQSYLFIYFNMTRRNQKWQQHPTPVLLPRKSHGRRSLVGCSPWGRYELDMTERLHFHFSLSHVGEGNGNTLQCSCLENPRDGGAWWAAVYGAAQSWTRLKQLKQQQQQKELTEILAVLCNEPLVLINCILGKGIITCIFI